jgi:hypothetical protein
MRNRRRRTNPEVLGTEALSCGEDSRDKVHLLVRHRMESRPSAPEGLSRGGVHISTNSVRRLHRLNIGSLQ